MIPEDGAISRDTWYEVEYSANGAWNTYGRADQIETAHLILERLLSQVPAEYRIVRVITTREVV